MKKLLLFLLVGYLGAATVHAQIIAITAADMPVPGDTLRWSAARPDTSRFTVFAFAQTGVVNHQWDFSMLEAAQQGVDTYKRAAQVNPLYNTISPTAYGYKVADSLSFPGIPLSVRNAYTFFNVKSSPSRFVAEGYGAQISGIPTPASYSDEDEIYFFPLNIGNRDSSTYNLNVMVPGLGSLTCSGTRITFVDGRGAIKTPYLAVPTPCLRVRAEVYGTDMAVFGGISVPIPHHTVAYQWLSSGEHYPLLWVTTDKMPDGAQYVRSVRYRDIARTNMAVVQAAPVPQKLEVSTDPATKTLRLLLPQGWEKNTVEVFDLNGRLVHKVSDAAAVDGSSWASGLYILRVTSPLGMGFAKTSF